MSPMSWPRIPCEGHWLDSKDIVTPSWLEMGGGEAAHHQDVCLVEVKLYDSESGPQTWNGTWKQQLGGSTTPLLFGEF